MRLSTLVIGGLFAVLLARCSSGVPAPSGTAEVHTIEILSPDFHIDRVYRSMEGPTHTQLASISDVQPPELVWITAAEMEAVDPAGRPIQAQDKLCHVNVGFPDSDKWQKNNERLFHGQRGSSSKWFVLVQGQYEIRLPEGFGIPVYSDEPLNVFTMLFNLDPQLQDLDMRVKLRFEYVRDRDLAKPMMALSRSGILNKVYLDASDAGDHDDGTTCVAHAANADEVETDSQGRRTATHFTVPPGRHVFRNSFRLQGEMRVHYIYAHLHVYGESIELFDTATGKSIFKSVARNNERMTGIAEMTHFSSTEPIVLEAGRSYEVVSTYDNTTAGDIDAMAMFYLYFENDSFRRPSSESAALQGGLRR